MEEGFEEINLGKDYKVYYNADAGIYKVALYKNNIIQEEIYFDKYEKEDTLNEESYWQEFRQNGLLWWVNMLLHTFGWAIIMEESKNKIKVYPKRVKFRGFSEDINTQGYIKISNYLKENAEFLLEESIN